MNRHRKKNEIGMEMEGVGLEKGMNSLSQFPGKENRKQRREQGDR